MKGQLTAICSQSPQNLIFSYFTIALFCSGRAKMYPKTIQRTELLFSCSLFVALLLALISQLLTISS